MSNSTDGQLEQLVKARWLALGLSQNDLAEALGAPGQSAPKAKTANGSRRPDVGRLMQVADALGVSHDLFQGLAPTMRKAEPCDADSEAMQTLLELRLLRVFRELQDHNAKRMLIQLAEQIVKRQATPPDAG